MVLSPVGKGHTPWNTPSPAGWQFNCPGLTPRFCFNSHDMVTATAGKWPWCSSAFPSSHRAPACRVGSLHRAWPAVPKEASAWKMEALEMRKRMGTGTGKGKGQKHLADTHELKQDGVPRQKCTCTRKCVTSLVSISQLFNTVRQP